jgi:hypothetical protein
MDISGKAGTLENEESIYIHELQRLEPKAAEIESVRLVREIKRVNSYPITEQKLLAHLSKYFARQLDLDTMAYSISKLEPALKEISVFNSSDTLLEPLNIKRSVGILKEVDTALKNNLQYGMQMMALQQVMIPELVKAMNSLHDSKNAGEMIACNDRFSNIFEAILRNDKFALRHDDLIFEAPRAHISDLTRMIPNGYFFHILLEEEIRKAHFDEWKSRLPKSMVAQSDRIGQYAIEIEKGVDAAYQMNMRMINLALLLYAYVKWLCPEKL